MATFPQQANYVQRPNMEYKRFTEEYFAGQDVRIYFGDMWVDEIVGLNFTLVENVAPIFGYASYVYDTVARGSRQIQGSFRINFKEAYYLHAILNQLDYEMQDRTIAFTGTTNFSDKEMQSNNITVDHLMGTVESVYTDDQFEKLALQFEKSLWGDSMDTSGAASIMQSHTNDRGNGSWFYPEDIKPNLAKYGYNILILYGPYTQTYAPDATTEKVSTTTHSLTGVHLTGVSQIVDNTGQPIYEEYTFIARDLDANVNLLDKSPDYSTLGQKGK